MRHLLIALVTLVALVGFNGNAIAQSTCTAYFASYLYPFYLLNITGTSNGMTSRQEKWFRKKGQKKYPNVCEDPEKATYIFITRGRLDEVQQPITVTRHASTTGPVTEVVGQTASSPSQTAQPIWGIRLETFMTTWQEKETRTVNRFHTDVFLIMTKKPLAQAVSQEDYLPPMLAAQADGYDSDRVALEQAFESITFVGVKK
jgi:hypothetical protein